jgi:hypothetical protein
MLDVVRHLITRFRRIGDRPGDEDDLLLRKRAFTLMAAVVHVAAVLWAMLGIVSHRPLLTCVSIAFGAVDAVLLIAFARSGRFRPIVNGMLGAGLLYVVAAHLALGGLASTPSRWSRGCSPLWPAAHRSSPPQRRADRSWHPFCSVVRPTSARRNLRMPWLWIIIIVAVVLLLFGGVGYGRRSTMGSYYGGGVGIIGVILIILLVLFLLGVLR